MDPSWDDESLRDRVDPELSALFTEAGGHHARLIANLIDRAQDDPALELGLIEALEMAIEEGDDATGGTAWVALVLGEIRSREAVGVLIRILDETDDETLQEAATDGLARIGPFAMEAVGVCLDEDPARPGARGMIRAIETGSLRPGDIERGRDILLDLLGRAHSLASWMVEELALSLARLGDRRALDPLRALLGERFHGSDPSLQDAIEMLEGNERGLPLISGPAPWRDRFGWLTGRFPSPVDDDRVDLDHLWRGMGRPGEEAADEENG
ncbi:MAG: hypothetical protein JXP34_08565 [Planctomycetes bacterium]|nr:hypothetical protein [Planctomycetota bacterium]